MAHSPIFRESALARLASPEQLDSMVQVTTTRGWIATITLVASAAAVVVWSIIGEVTTYVKAQGIILNHDGAIIDISAPHNSTLSRILIKGGDRVEAGEVVAETVDRQAEEEFRITAMLVDERQRILSELETNFATEVDQSNELETRIIEARSRLQSAEYRMQELETLISTRRILAPASGRITEVKAAVGTLLFPGQPVASIETGSGDLEALIYVPPAEGKRIEPGMEALISPSTVRREEHGSIKGTVTSISSFPVTIEGISAKLQNRGLAQAISQNGSPYSSRVKFNPDPDTASGFAWTSEGATGQVLTSGTLALAEIKIESQPPITLVIPLLKQMFGS